MTSQWLVGKFAQHFGGQKMRLTHGDRKLGSAGVRRGLGWGMEGCRQEAELGLTNDTT